MKRYIRYFLKTAAVILMMACYLHSMQSAGLLAQRNRTVTILPEGEALSYDRVREIRETEAEQESSFSFAAWTQEDGRTAENKDLGRRVQVPVLVVCGNTQLLLRENVKLEEEDYDGCLLSRDTAIQLFGSPNAENMKVWIDEKAYIVRGILRDTENAAVIQAKSREQKKFLALTVECGMSWSRQQVQDVFMMRHGISGKIIKLETLSSIASVLLAVFPLLAGGGIIKMIWLFRRRFAGMPLKNANAVGMGICWAGTVCMIFLLIYILAKILVIPADMIPTKWSDFTFWSRWLETEKESMLLLLLTEKQIPWRGCVYDFQTILCFSVGTWILWGIAKKGINGKI